MSLWWRQASNVIHGGEMFQFKMAICMIKGYKVRMSFLTSINGYQPTHTTEEKEQLSLRHRQEELMVEKNSVDVLSAVVFGV